MRVHRPHLALAVGTALATLLGIAHADPGGPTLATSATVDSTMSMQVGETQLIQLSEKITRISVADPTVADVQVVTPKQVLVTAKGVGVTNIILWGESDSSKVVAVECGRNLGQLRSQLARLFPGEKISVSSVGDLVVLSGQVDDLRTPGRAAEVAKLYSTQLANLIEVTGDQQVQLEVRFAEVSRSALREMGLNFLWRDGARGYVGGATVPGTQTGSYLGGGTNGLQIPGTAAASGPPLVGAPSFGNAFNLFFSTGLSKFPFSAVLSVMSDEGLAKVLAEPTLVALSGQEAKFHAGGEIPILIARQLGEVTVDYKQFGVQLQFTPTVLGERTIDLQMQVEVSEPDPTAGVTLGGFTVPGFKSRSSSTTVRLRDGQSFAVAGLLSENVRSVIAKVPILGELPILGALFRSTQFQRQETELLVVVRANLVRPHQARELPPLPGEGEFTDPGDFSLFLLGRQTGPAESSKHEPDGQPTSTSSSSSSLGGPSGPIGFVRDFE